MSNAIIYARFSCSKQREASIEDQLRVCRAWCESHGHTVVAEYSDYAISGRTDDRPQFQAMIAAAGEAELCVVYMMDRFSRDVYDAPLYKKKLRDKGCRVVSATEAMPDGPEALLIEKIYEGLAAVESAHTSVRVKRGMTGNALKCLANGVLVFGYSIVDGKYEIDPAQAEVVREVFRRHNAGESSNSIARDLAARGYKTRHHKPVGYSFIHTMLHNEKYRGIYRWNDVRQVGGMPRIIDDATWFKAQGVKPKRDRANESWRGFPLAGRALCAECGRNLQGSTAHGHGGTYYYYVCPSRHIKPPRAEWLEGELCAKLRELLSDAATVHQIALEVQEYHNSTPAAARVDEAAKRLRNARSVIDNLTRAVAQGMDYSLVREQLEEAQATAEAAQHELDLAKLTDGFDIELFEQFLGAGANLTDGRLLDLFVYQVMVSDDTVIAVLNINKNREPVRVEMVRGIVDGWAKSQSTRTFEVVDGWAVVRFARAAA